MVFNPLHLYLSNTISSDILFISLSITWFSLLLWVIHKPSIAIHFFHAIILFLAFTVRYFALFYPIISLFAFIISKSSLILKLNSLLCCAALIGSFIFFTQNLYYQICQKHIFSPFSGWLLANNALYAYRYVSNEQHKTPPRELENLDLQVRDYFDSTQNNPGHLMEQGETYFHFMWISTSPLRAYAKKSIQPGSKLKDLGKWAFFAPIFKDYGWWIIKNYPIQFSRYYLFANVKRYSLPPVEFLESYNSGLNEVPDYIKNWFHYKSNILSYKVKNPVYTILPLYSIWSAIINIQILLFIIIYVWLKCYRYYPIKLDVLLFLSFFGLINFAFEVFSTLISLRFQIFSIWIFTCFSYILLGCIIIQLKKTDA
ncbi:hypothetical protein [Chitinophaga sancti]|nr:hypothetical protein [Chitinophaga sancti]WQG88312.1 hypothetical protein SR876_25665 [Chitinophaga sancti]